MTDIGATLPFARLAAKDRIRPQLGHSWSALGTALHAPGRHSGWGSVQGRLQVMRHRVEDGAVWLKAEIPPVWTCRLPT